MKFQDYYEILGVPRDVSPQGLKKAYRKLALKWHPDRNRGDHKKEVDAEVRFKKINEANEVLSDPEKREKYDRFGENWKQGQDFQPPSGQGTMSPEEFEQAFGGSGGFSDFFQEMFGGKFRQDFGGAPPSEGQSHARYKVRGADVRAELHLPISEAIRGGKRSFEVPARMACPTCGGTGASGQHVCPTCGGVGQVRRQQVVDLNIPKHVRDGMTLRLKGLGEPGASGGQSGDLHLRLHLIEDAQYRLVDGLLETKITLMPWEAHFGTKLDVTTGQGVVALNIPPGTRAGKRLRLRGQGLSQKKEEVGDCMVEVVMDLPSELSVDQERLLKEMSS
ncbi:MAG: J domain-containing protein [Planctomycetota bacterium]|nr:J domain-containing protein [Planctomycetota bacterium]